MEKKEIVSKLNKLEINSDLFMVIGGAALVLQGIKKETGDIDLSCSKDTYDNLNWSKKIGYFGKEIKYFADFEIAPSFYDLSRTDIIEGFKVANLEACYELKLYENKPKDEQVRCKLKSLLEKKK